MRAYHGFAGNESEPAAGKQVEWSSGLRSRDKVQEQTPALVKKQLADKPWSRLRHLFKITRGFFFFLRPLWALYELILSIASALNKLLFTFV